MRALVDARLVATDRPLSTTPSRLVHYRVGDPYLRFWLHHIQPQQERIVRGRGDVVADRMGRVWPSYRGAAVEPVIAAALEALLPDDRLGGGTEIGRYWSRDHSVEVDLVIADRDQAPARPVALGSIKWRGRTPIDAHDVAELALARSRVPGAEQATLFAVSRSGGQTAGLDVVLTPDDLLSASASG